MTKPPDLSEDTKRKLWIKWDDLLAEAGLTGQHLEWHAQAPKFGHVKVMIKGVDSGQRLSLPVSTDNVGIDASWSVANGRFRHLAREYWIIWQASGTGWEVWKTWLDFLKRQVLGELASLWKGRSDAIDRWYERVCRPAIEDALTKSLDEWAKEARLVELRRLQRNRSTASVVTANPIMDDKSAVEANETPPTGQLATQEMIETGGAVGASGDLDSVNQVSPDDPRLLADAKVRALEKSETLGWEDASAEFTPEQTEQEAILDLLARVLAKQNTTIEGWAQSHKFGRTTVFDWKSARAGKSSKGKVSDSKSAQIETAIRKDAEDLGLTRTADQTSRSD